MFVLLSWGGHKIVSKDDTEWTSGTMLIESEEPFTGLILIWFALEQGGGNSGEVLNLDVESFLKQWCECFQILGVSKFECLTLINFIRNFIKVPFFMSTDQR